MFVDLSIPVLQNNKLLTWDLPQSQLTPAISILIFQKIASSPELGKIKEIDKVD